MCVIIVFIGLLLGVTGMNLIGMNCVLRSDDGSCTSRGSFHSRCMNDGVELYPVSFLFGESLLAVYGVHSQGCVRAQDVVRRALLLFPSRATAA